jgi:hypothetical protein
MQSVLIYLPSQAYPLKTYKDEELGICLVPTKKMNPSTGYFQPKFATAFIHYDKEIDIERTKILLKDLVIFKNFLYANRWLNIWYSTPQASRFKELINNISSIDNLINSLYVPYVKDYFTVDYSKFKLLEVIPKQATVDFFPLFNKFVSLIDPKNKLPLRRLIELFSFNSEYNPLYHNEYFSISISFIILEVLIKDEIKEIKKVDVCPKCGFEKESDKHIKELIREYVQNSKLIHKDEKELIEKILHKFSWVRNLFFHSGRKVDQEMMLKKIKDLRGSTYFDIEDDINIADGTRMGIWTLHSFVRRILISKLENI